MATDSSRTWTVKGGSGQLVASKEKESSEKRSLLFAVLVTSPWQEQKEPVLNVLLPET